MKICISGFLALRSLTGEDSPVFRLVQARVVLVVIGLETKFKTMTPFLFLIKQGITHGDSPTTFEGVPGE